MHISRDLKWNNHILEIVKKVSKRLYFLRQLKRAKTQPKDLLTFYLTCVRPVMEYACPVYNDSLPIHLKEDLEKLQKRALRIIYPELSHAEALFDAGVEYLFERRQFLTTKLFKEVVDDHNHKLYKLLPSTSFSEYNLRKEVLLTFLSTKPVDLKTVLLSLIA